MKISDRDLKLIMIVLILCVLILPYLFIARPKKEQIATLKADTATKQVELDELNTLYDKKDFYLAEIDNMTKQTDAIIGKYAQGLRQENLMMLLREAELISPMLRVVAGEFNEYEDEVIYEGELDENGKLVGNVTARKTESKIKYEGDYFKAKEMINFFNNNSELMHVTALEMKFNDETGLVEGEFMLSQYAMIGDGRTLAPAEIPAMEHGNDAAFFDYIVYDEFTGFKNSDGSDDDEDDDDEE